MRRGCKTVSFGLLLLLAAPLRADQQPQETSEAPISPNPVPQVPLSAAPPLRPPSGNIGVLGLLANPMVQQELGVTSDQVTEVRRIAYVIGTRHETDVQALPSWEAESDSRGRMDTTHSIDAESRAALGGLLSMDQLTRYDQIVLQARAPMAFADPDVQTALGLTEYQKTKALRIYQKHSAYVRRIALGNSAPANQTWLTLAARRRATRRLVALLRRPQKAKWASMIGNPINLEIAAARPALPASSSNPLLPPSVRGE